MASLIWASVLTYPMQSQHTEKRRLPAGVPRIHRCSDYRCFRLGLITSGTNLYSLGTPGRLEGALSSRGSSGGAETWLMLCAGLLSVLLSTSFADCQVFAGVGLLPAAVFCCCGMLKES